MDYLIPELLVVKETMANVQGGTFGAEVKSTCCAVGSTGGTATAFYDVVPGGLVEVAFFALGGHSAGPLGVSAVALGGGRRGLRCPLHCPAPKMYSEPNRNNEPIYIYIYIIENE